MLLNAGLGKAFWAEPVTYACHLINKILATMNDGKTAKEAWSGKPTTNYDFLHTYLVVMDIVM